MFTKFILFKFKIINLIKLNEMKKIIFAIILGGLGAISCTSKTPQSTSNTISVEKLAQGKTVFENSCGKCHDLPKPTAHNPQDWVGIINSMAPKAKLNDEQHQLVYDYIVSVKK